MAAEESGAPHLVEDPQAIIVRLRHLNRQRARTVRFVEEGENNAHFSYVGAIEGAKSDSGKSIEVELAINQLEELIADNESKIYVTVTKPCLKCRDGCRCTRSRGFAS